MDDALRMDVGERVGNLRRVIDGAPRVERSAAHDELERVSGHELEDEIGLSLLLADFVERGDIWV